jgi:hypothetical protein
MPAGTEMVGDGAIGGEEPLGVPGRLKPLQAPFPLTGGLMRILGAVIELYFTRGRIALLQKAESVRLTARPKQSDEWSVFGLSTEQGRF